jgi:hypothetical protein
MDHGCLGCHAVWGAPAVDEREAEPQRGSLQVVPMWTSGALHTAQSWAVSNHRRNRFGLSYQYPRLALDGVASVGRENVGFKRILARRQVQLKLGSEPESPVKMVVVPCGANALRCCPMSAPRFRDIRSRRVQAVAGRPPNAKRQFLQKGSYAGDAVQVHRLDLYTPSPCRKDAVEEERHVGLCQRLATPSTALTGRSRRRSVTSES